MNKRRMELYRDGVEARMFEFGDVCSVDADKEVSRALRRIVMKSYREIGAGQCRR